MEKKVYELTIDPELRDYIPPLQEWEYESLKNQIVAEGCMEPITVWNGVIVDGHNRYRICHENDIPFAITEMTFADKVHAKRWMASKQLGRRNLNPFQKCELVLPLEPIIKEEAQARAREIISLQRRGLEVPPNLAEAKDTRDIMADMAGVSHGMWDMVKVIISEADEDIKEEIRAEKIAVSKVYSMLRPKKQPNKPKEKKPEEQQTQKNEEKRYPTEKKSVDQPAILIDEPTVIENIVEQEEEHFSPADFSEVEAQVEICIQDFMMNFRETLKWIGQQHVSGKNEAAVKALLKEGHEAAVEALHNRFEQLKGEAK